MILERTSLISGKKNRMELDITVAEFDQCFYNWQQERMLIQDAFYMLTEVEREFIKTGIMPEEWANLGDDE
jgi:hypothetical protein